MKKSGAVRGKSAPLFRLFCEHPLWSPRRRGTPRRARLGTARAHLRARTLALAQDLRRRDARTPDARHHDLRVRRNPRASGRVDGNLGACDARQIIPRPRSDATGPRRRVEPRRAEPSAARRGPPPRVRARRRDALEPVRGGARARSPPPRPRAFRRTTPGFPRRCRARPPRRTRPRTLPGRPAADPPPSPPRRPRRASRAPPGPPPRPASPRGASARSAGAPAPGSPRDPKVRQISPLARANDPRRALALKRGRRARSRVRARRARARPRPRLTRHPPRPSRPALAGTAAFARARDVLKVRAPGRVRAASSRDFRTGVSARRATRPTRPCPLARAPKRSFATG